MSMMVKNLIKEKRGMISAIAAVVILYIVLECFGITCPIKFITGVSCAGCGMSRAWLACLRLDFKKAFYYHPLFIFPPCMVCVFLMRNKMPDLLTSAHYQKQGSMKNWRKDMRICKLDGQKMRRKPLLTFARIMAYDI